MFFNRARAGGGAVAAEATRALAALCLAAAFLQTPVFAAAAAEETPLVAYGARIAGDKARTRIVIDFDRKPDFEVRYIAKPDRIVVDLPATAFGFAADDLAARGLFQDIRYGAIDASSARIVLTTAKPARLVHSEIQPDEAGKGFRLVLDAEMATDAVFAELVKGQVWEQAVPASVMRGDRIDAPDPARSGEFVVAVDAGHGGIDAGAAGASTKTSEKDITLAFARILAERLNKEPGIKAFLTREKDDFLSLSERVTIARQGGANLLVSLHADTLRQANIRGATVYTISDTASDHMAAALAERENLSDDVGGVARTTEPAEVTDILIDLTRRETQAFSIAMAKSVVSSFEGQVALINNPHRYAGFQVLQAHDVPSVLLELGFLSNKEDEKLLLDETWRTKVADLLTEAVRRYRAPVMANGG